MKLTGTNGFMIGLVVHEAIIQDRDGAVLVLQSIRWFYPFQRRNPTCLQALELRGNLMAEIS